MTDSNDSIKVRQAVIEDLDAAAALFDEYRMFYDQASDPEGAKLFIFDRFEHRESVIFLAIDESDGQAVGFTQLYPTFSSISMKRMWILNDLYVREAYRGRGAASGLLEAAGSYAASTKAKGLELATALTNIKAQVLYERFGYEKDTAFYHYFMPV